MPLPLRWWDEVVKGEVWAAVRWRRGLLRAVWDEDGPDREARVQRGWEVLKSIAFLFVWELLDTNRGALPIVRALAVLKTASCREAAMFAETRGGTDPGSCRDIPRGRKRICLD